MTLLDPQLVLLRLGLALIFGAIIGIEREWRHKNAGIKTNTLVAIGSATFALMSNTFGPNNHNPAQLAAAVVSGIGFIGAGVIIHRGANVQGVTTAATLWAGASMGVALGLGFYLVASLTFAGIIIVQFGMREAVGAIEARRGPQQRTIEVRVDCDSAALAAVNAEFKKFVPLRQSTSRTADGMEWRATFTVSADEVASIEERLLREPGVKKFESRQTLPDT
jgi:putative Mg2+ transporter-C (MgtC) family protein